jgi:hypothetical protein
MMSVSSDTDKPMLKPGAISIRLAEDSDNDRVIELAKRCHQEGMITLFVNRLPRFNTLHRLLDPGSFHYLASREDRALGLVGVVHFPARVLDRTCKVGYLMDLRVDEEFRRGITSFRLVKAAVDHLQKSDTDMVIINIINDNKRSLVFTSGRGGLPGAHFLGDNRIFNLLPIHHMRLNKRFTIERPTERDVPEMLELYRKYSEGFSIAPLLSEDRFMNYLASIEGLSLDSFLLAREEGKIKAITGVWDGHRYMNYQVLKLNFSIRAVMGVLKFLSLFMRAPQPVRLNVPLNHLSLVLYGHDDCPEALDTLFRKVNNDNLGSRYTSIMLYAQQNDKMFSFLKKFKGISVKSEMHLFSKDTTVFEKLGNKPSPVLLDLTMII